MKKINEIQNRTKVSNAIYMNQGARLSMEDYCHCMEASVRIGDELKDLCVQYVCDGHGGSEVAHFVHAHIQAMLAQEWRTHASILDLLHNMSSELTTLVKALPHALTTGTTLCLSLIDKNARRLYIMNCGDSRCVAYAHGSGKIIIETKDHSPYDTDEIRRVLDAGGFIFRNRGMPRVMGVLGLTRAFGDLEHAPYVISDPDIYQVDLSAQTGAVVTIVASDGYWNMRKDQVSIISSYKGKNARGLLSALLGHTSFHDNVAIIVSIISS